MQIFKTDTRGEITSKQITVAVDVTFEKDEETFEAQVTCIYNSDENTGWTQWETILVNEEELPNLTNDEEAEILKYAENFAEELAG